MPRCLRLPDPSDTQLHVFSDASKDAYSAVAYLLCKYEDRDPTCRLIASKNRVSPIKAVTIPRLELMGAVLSARLATSILKVLTVNATMFWTDSTNVLFWVHNRSRTFKPFVANRVGEIQRLTNPEEWRHVPGDKNPADLPTRGLTASQLNDSQTWKEGPAFLLADESSWPEKLSVVDPRSVSADEERRKTTHVTGATNPYTAAVGRLDPRRYSRLRKLFRVTAWLQRFIKNCRLPKDARQRSVVLTSEELNQSEIFWLGRSQREMFPDKEKDEKLRRFNPRYDENGILRANGRLKFANELPFDSRYPILLSKDHPLTKLVILDAHEKRGHGTGIEHLLTELRSRFWILKGRRAVRNLIDSCSTCRRRFLTRQTGQMMAPLPKVRVQMPLRAFDRVGVDYAGPFKTKQGRGKARAKRYLCLFTCLCT